MSDRRKYALIAFGGVFGFWLLTKALNMIAKNPGGQDYTRHCAQCHGDAGEGIGALVPPLAYTDWLEENQDQIPCIIRHGLKDSILVEGIWYNEEMLAVDQLNNIQIGNISNYISKQFTTEQKFYSQTEVEALLDACK
jgi:mono/diheme cytochrome c family protein